VHTSQTLIKTLLQKISTKFYPKNSAVESLLIADCILIAH
jgi:hypothetical protein